LRSLDDDNKRRREIAKMYLKGISNPRISLPFYNGSKDHVFHVFIIETDNREELLKFLKKRNIECSIHYPRPPHKQKAFLEYAQLELPITEKIHERVISLPMSPVLQNEEVQFVIDALNNY
ncbi:MAG: aminotransferase, partial [Flavobacteriaceae bacterium]